MKIRYFADTDTLYIDLRDRPSVRTEEISDLVSIDFDSEEGLVGITIESAKQQVDLSSINILTNLEPRKQSPIAA
jgi:uncharacterized protein YuzE